MPPTSLTTVSARKLATMPKSAMLEMRSDMVVSSSPLLSEHFITLNQNLSLSCCVAFCLNMTRRQTMKERNVSSLLSPSHPDMV